MKVIWLDAETTGTDPKVNDIVQVAMLVEIDGRLAEEYTACCQPYNWDAIEPSALAVNGLTIEQLRKYPEPKLVYEQIVELVGKHMDKYNKDDKFTLAGQKVDFDAGFLREFFVKAGDAYYGSWFNNRYVDLLALVRILRYTGQLTLANDRLATICASLSIDLKAHDALEDIHGARAAFKELMYRHLQRPRCI